MCSCRMLQRENFARNRASGIGVPYSRWVSFARMNSVDTALAIRPLTFPPTSLVPLGRRAGVKIRQHERARVGIRLFSDQRLVQIFTSRFRGNYALFCCEVSGACGLPGYWDWAGSAPSGLRAVIVAHTAVQPPSMTRTWPVM